MANKPWKASERVTARILRTRRNPNSGEWRTDMDVREVTMAQRGLKWEGGMIVEDPDSPLRNPAPKVAAFAVEHKAWRNFPKRMADALDQAKRAARPEQTGIAIFAWHRGQGLRTRRFVLIELEDAAEWWGLGDG